MFYGSESLTEKKENKALRRTEKNHKNDVGIVTNKGGIREENDIRCVLYARLEPMDSDLSQTQT